MTPEERQQRIAELPLWAQQEIFRLERQIEEARAVARAGR